MKILIADDSRVSRRVLVGAMRHECDFEDIVEAEDGEQALSMGRDKSVGLILLDWNMPKMQGIDVLKTLRAENVKSLIIMVTGEKDRAHVVEAFDAGANSYIVKPFTVKTVAEKVMLCVEGQARNKGRPRMKTALIADDSAVMRKILIGMLGQMDEFEDIAQAGDGLEALEQAKARNFDLILLDWNMPKMIGIDALKAIREFDTTTPIIMVTSEKEGARVVEAFEAGANNYVIKPFEPTGVVQKIRQTLGPRD